MKDPRVEAIRKDELVGNGTCTTVDEALEDSELLEYLDEDGVTTAEAAVKWAHDYEGLQKEQATNCRFGEDSDLELKAQQEWDEARDAADEQRNDDFHGDTRRRRGS